MPRNDLRKTIMKNDRHALLMALALTTAVSFGIANPTIILAETSNPVESDASAPALIDPESLAAKLARQAKQLKQSILLRGLRAFQRAQEGGEAQRERLAIIDFGLPSTKKRLWVFDLAKQKLLFHEWVAHGRNTGINEAKHFSNRLGSKQSSLGTFVTTETYHGQHGYSLRLAGLDDGLNDMAMRRRIVIHGAPYVGKQFIAQYGRLGRSWGCPAVRPKITRNLIDTIKEGSVLYIYHPTLTARIRQS